jgi:hypothetical protein
MNAQPTSSTTDDRPMRSWPLYVLALPAAVAIWSGWVGLGGMTGFGVVHPLPGIVNSFEINTAITLPIGVEAYAAFALDAWLTRKRLTEQTRRFAMVSALAALVLGAAGQIAYHLLEVAHSRAVASVAAKAGRPVADVAKSMPMQAPVFVIVLVAIFPVAVLGAGATLAHLIHRDARTGEAVTDTVTQSTADAMTQGSDPEPEQATPEPVTQDTPEWMTQGTAQVTSEVTPEAMAQVTVQATHEATPEPVTQDTPKPPRQVTRRAPARAPQKSHARSRRTDAELIAELQGIVADHYREHPGEEINVKPVAAQLGIGRDRARRLLDQMNVRPIRKAN